MALRYKVDGRILRFEFAGGTPVRDIYTQFHRAYHHYALPDDVVILVDLRQSTTLSSRTPEIVKMISEFVLEHPDRPGNRLALVLPEGQVERWAPLFTELDGKAGVAVQAFAEEDKARIWLESDSASAEGH